MPDATESPAQQDTAPSDSGIGALPLDLLKIFGAKLCSVRHRKDWWATSGSHELSVMGRMVKEAFKTRNDVRGLKGHDLKEITKEEFIETLDGSAGTVHNFLEGAVTAHPRKVNYPRLAKDALRVLMLGSADPDPKKLDKELQSEAKWIIDFFFRQGDAQDAERIPNKRSFFDPRFKMLGGIARYIEAAAELRSLAVARSQGVESRVVRVSGRIGFPLFRKNSADLSQVGIATLRCLQAGVKVALVYCSVSEECEAAKTAKAFKRYVKKARASALKNLRTLSLEPGAKIKGGNGNRWAGEYLNRTFRWTLYERFDDLEPIILVSRSNQDGPAAIIPDEGESDDFQSWCNLFVWKKPRKSSI